MEKEEMATEVSGRTRRNGKESMVQQGGGEMRYVKIEKEVIGNAVKNEKNGAGR